MSRMADLPTLQAKIIAALQQKIPAARCPLCRNSDWDVQPGTFSFHHQFRAGYTTSSTMSAHPCAAMVCKICGNTHFISIAVLAPELLKEVI
jgi:hypothetical protein